jgi:hypothetical protein
MPPVDSADETKDDTDSFPQYSIDSEAEWVWEVIVAEAGLGI